EFSLARIARQRRNVCARVGPVAISRADPLMKTPAIALVFLACIFAPTRELGAQTGGEQLTRDDVGRIIAQAATQAARTNPGAIIAVTDREGFVLGAWDMQRRLPAKFPMFSLSPPILRPYGLLSGAITRAGTAAFLSSDQEA